MSLSAREKLQAVQDVTDKDGQFEVLIKDILPFVELGFINVLARGRDGIVCAAISQAGRDHLEELDRQDQQKILQDKYEIRTGTLPDRVRSHKVKKPQYPFDELNVGQFFFVGCINEKEEQAVRSAANTSNKRFAEVVGEKEHLEKKGQPTKLVPDYRYTRKFEVRKMYRYEKVGDFTCPCDGILVMRVELDV